jgi:GAF domain-containing protein
MDESSNRRANYVNRLQEDTQRIVRELMAENEKLRTLAASAERENRALQEQLTAVRAELERYQREKTTLRVQLDEMARNSQRYTEEFASVEKRSADLANLYVSSYQLHGTLDRETVLSAIREIVINLIGSEELAVFELGDDGSSFDLVTSFGIDETHYAKLSVCSHPIGRLAAAGDMFLAGRAPIPADLPALVACVPLKLDGRVTGAVVLFSLLDHKDGLQELDFELFDLLASHAATALYCTALHARVAAGSAA